MRSTLSQREIQTRQEWEISIINEENLPTACIALNRVVKVKMNWFLCVLFLASLADLGLTAKDEKKWPTVKTPLGKIKGTYELSANGRKYESYRGIPYALPPTGERRFEVSDSRIRNFTIIVKNNFKKYHFSRQ